MKTLLGRILSNTVDQAEEKQVLWKVIKAYVLYKIQDFLIEVSFKKKLLYFHALAFFWKPIPSKEIWECVKERQWDSPFYCILGEKSVLVFKRKEWRMLKRAPWESLKEGYQLADLTKQECELPIKKRKPVKSKSPKSKFTPREWPFVKPESTPFIDEVKRWMKR